MTAAAQVVKLSHHQQFCCACRHGEQAAQLGSSQQALQGVQAEFADQQHAKTTLASQLQASEAMHAELQNLHAAQNEEVASLKKQLSERHSLVHELQVSTVHTPSLCTNWVPECLVADHLWSTVAD